MKTPITYYGGKQKMVKHILKLIPYHKIYCEPFFGGGAIFFAKEKSEVEIINDLNGEVINFYKVLKTKFKSLQSKIKTSLHSREIFRKAHEIYKNASKHTDLERAWAFWNLTNQGFAGKIGSWGFGKTPSLEKSLSRKRGAFDKSLSERLETTQIESNDAIKVIKRSDTKDSFFYIDPPYIGSNQGHYDGYTEEDYEKLLSLLSNIKGKFLLSSYPSSILDRFIKKNNWHSRLVKQAISVSKKGKQKTEMLVSNYPIDNLKKTKPMKIIIQLIKEFISFHNKRLRKSELGAFIDKASNAIKQPGLHKKDTLIIEILKIIRACIRAYNNMKYAKTFSLKDTTIKRLETKVNESPLDGIEPELPEVMSSEDFAKLEFESLGFKGKWLDFIGDPAPGFSAMIYGKPKMGKSYLAMDFAGYLAENHGTVLFVAAEEKLDATLKKKLNETNVASDNLFVSASIPENLDSFEFVFLDSVNKLALKPAELEQLRSLNPDTSFIFIFQTTKQGNFRGANEFQHDVDIVIEIPEKGKAIQFGRYNQGGMLSLF